MSELVIFTIAGAILKVLAYHVTIFSAKAARTVCVKTISIAYGDITTGTCMFYCVRSSILNYVVFFPLFIIYFVT